MENAQQKISSSSLEDVVFSWSMEDVLNKDLYNAKVDTIPKTFSSTADYMKSFVNPLIEETHAALLSCMTKLAHPPIFEVYRVKKSKPPNALAYKIELMSIDNGHSRHEENNLWVGDLIAFTDVRPKCIADLNRPKWPYHIALVTGMKSGDDTVLSILSSKPILNDAVTWSKAEDKETLYAVFLMNLTTNIRIWNSLKGDNMNVIQNLLQIDSAAGDKCGHCPLETINRSILSEYGGVISSFKLDDSQEAAVLSCIAARECPHCHPVKLLWGPPGTGKTKTVSSLLSVLLKMNCRTLTCAPTNIAVIGVAKRLMNLVKDAQASHISGYGLGDIVLYGNGERMKIDDHEDLHDIFLYYRVKCLSELVGWRKIVEVMIGHLEDPVEKYRSYSKKERKKLMCDKIKGAAGKILSFKNFTKKEFNLNGKRVISCFTDLFTHLPTNFISIEVLRNMIRVIELIQTIQTLIENGTSVTKGGFRKALNGIKNEEKNSANVSKLNEYREECLQILKLVSNIFHLPVFISDSCIRRFCLENATLVFCTASSSIKMLTRKMTPVKFLIIDEAAQLKECESTIPLQLNGLRHVVLIGDEKQLPAMVQSEICGEAAFGRSLFERLVELGHPKHLLKIQYRMHPSISLFPNGTFYNEQILDGPNVKEQSYGKRFVNGDMFGSYSFINVPNGNEVFDDCSSKNMAEVAMVAEIVASLFKESVVRKQKVSVGCISPYKAQVHAIQKAIGNKYSNKADSDFCVKVKSVDGFQGGEEDVIIISTVRCNRNGSIGFLLNLQRANVALTRARYCLWILGSASTLLSSGSVWKKLVDDAKSRGCFYNAYEDKNLAGAFLRACVNLARLDQLLCMRSILFREARWMVCFDDCFLKSMAKIKNMEIRLKVLSLLMMLSNGWQPPQKNETPEGLVSTLLEQYNVHGVLHLIWNVDIQKKNKEYIQVLRVWDVLPKSRIPELRKNVDILFGNYTVDTISRCKCRLLERNLVVPMTWALQSDDGVGKKAKEYRPKFDPNQSLASQLGALNLNNEAAAGPSTSTV